MKKTQNSIIFALNSLLFNYFRTRRTLKKIFLQYINEQNQKTRERGGKKIKETKKKILQIFEKFHPRLTYYEF